MGFKTRKTNNKSLIVFVLFVLLFIGIGYAFLNGKLDIVGNMKIKDSSWNIYFANVQEVNDSIEAINMATIDDSKSHVDFSIKLKEPGDTYQFLIDIVNDGSIDAMIDSVDKTSIPDNLKGILEYSVTYTNGNKIRHCDELDTKTKRKLEVTIKMKENVTESDLVAIAENNKLNLGFDVNYIQKSDTCVQSSEESYEIRLDAVEGTVSPNSISRHNGDFYNLPTPIRVGYTFLGWYNGIELVSSDDLVNLKTDLKLTARWQVNKYTITLSNEDDLIITETKEVTYDDVYDLPTPEKTGYTFIGWYLDKNYTQEVKANDKVKITENTNIYAKIIPIVSTVSFDATGGSSITSAISVTYNSKYGTLPTPSRTGYTFSGWFTDQDGGSLVTKDTVVSIVSKQTLYAHWRVNKARIYYNAGDAETIDPITTNPNTGVSRYWAIDNDGNIQSSTVSSSTLQIYYVDVAYGLKYDPVDWSNEYYINLKKTGYIAKKNQEWKCISGCTGNRTVYDQGVEYGSDDYCDNTQGDCSVILQLDWTPKVISINLYRNTSSTDTAKVTETFTYGVSNQRLGYKPDGTANYNTMLQDGRGYGTWSKSGYLFSGWALKQDATKRNYAPYNGVTNAWIDLYAPTVNLYGVWVSNQESNGTLACDVDGIKISCKEYDVSQFKTISIDYELTKSSDFISNIEIWAGGTGVGTFSCSSTNGGLGTRLYTSDKLNKDNKQGSSDDILVSAYNKVAICFSGYTKENNATYIVRGTSLR